MPEPAHKRKSERRQFHFSIKGQPLYPYLKMTREPFPRLLSTRIIENDGAEYFGPFLTRSTARILIDLVNQVFKLRTCTIEIDGEFRVPCTQYYAKRCTGPCVESLCSYEEYLLTVDLAARFLRSDIEGFESAVRRQIELCAESLDFERAAVLRDIMDRIRASGQGLMDRAWFGSTVDTLAMEVIDDEIKIYLVTTRGQRTMGSLVFSFPAFPGVEPQQALADVIEQFYTIHIPREIRVSHDFSDRRHLAGELSDKFQRNVRIVALRSNAAQVTAVKALVRTKLGADLEGLKPRMTVAEIGREMKRLFGLAKMPDQIEAFDAAHISGTDLVAAMSVWRNGKFVSTEYKSGYSDEQSEIAALREFISRRVGDANRRMPDLIVVDGGVSHLNAALEAVGDLPNRRFAAIGAVKPRGRHSEISHFVLENGSRVDFNADNEAMRVLQILRDDAHELANLTHRLSRDMGYYYELAGILPSLNERERQRLLVKFGSIKRIVEADLMSLKGSIDAGKIEYTVRDLSSYRLGKSEKVRSLIVPIRYDDPNGSAGDLRPIKAVN